MRCSNQFCTLQVYLPEPSRGLPRPCSAAWLPSKQGVRGCRPWAASGRAQRAEPCSPPLLSRRAAPAPALSSVVYHRPPVLHASRARGTHARTRARRAICRRTSAAGRCGTCAAALRAAVQHVAAQHSCVGLSCAACARSGGLRAREGEQIHRGRRFARACARAAATCTRSGRARPRALGALGRGRGEGGPSVGIFARRAAPPRARARGAGLVGRWGVPVRASMPARSAAGHTCGAAQL